METQELTTTKWQLDLAHSSVEFQVKHLMISKVKGQFKSFDIKIDGDDFTKSKITATIDTTSISTGDAGRDQHLMGNDFFASQEYPTILFESKSVAGDGEQFILVGDMTIKGQTHQVILEMEYHGTMTDPWGAKKAAFSVNGIIHRDQFGLTWNAALEAGGVLVSDEVRISCDIQMVQN